MTSNLDHRISEPPSSRARFPHPVRGRGHARVARAIGAALAALAIASHVHAEEILAAFDPIPATTNQSNVTVTANNTAKNDVMTLLAGSVLAFTYDTTEDTLFLTRAVLLGSDVHFVYGSLFHPCVVRTKIVEDRLDDEYPAAGFPDENGNFIMYVPFKFTGYVGNNCNGDETLYAGSQGLVLQGTFTRDAGTGAMSVTNLVTQVDYGPFVFYFSNVTCKLTGNLTLNVSSTSPGTMFSDGFEGGDVSEWTGSSP